MDSARRVWPWPTPEYEGIRFAIEDLTERRLMLLNDVGRRAE